MNALVFEKSVTGRHTAYLPEKTGIPSYELPENDRRGLPLDLPELSENDVSRHYTELEKKTHGVNDGFYPMGSCTMKYNPKVNEALSALPGFTDIHPLAPEESVKVEKEKTIPSEEPAGAAPAPEPVPAPAGPAEADPEE